MLTARESTSLDSAISLIRSLASDIGPRRPCSDAERRAADLLAEWLQSHEIETRLERFRGYASLGYPYGLIFTAALAGGLLQRRRSRLRGLGDVLTATSALTGAIEGDLRWTPLSDALRRSESVNVLAHVAAAGEPRLRVCLGAHLDTTRSGLMFHPSIVRHLARILRVPVVASLLLAGDPLIRRLNGGRRVHTLGIAGASFALLLLAEREFRGSDVPGANDNASGCAVVAGLAAESAASPLEHTDVDVLVSGCEESGLLGAQAYARSHRATLEETIFINFDSVGGDAPLTYILREGSAMLTRPASPRLVELAERIASRRPELGLVPARATPGLPTDATVMRAHRAEAITFLAQTHTIPNYHWPSDTFENIAPATVGSALEVGREMLSELDRDAGG